MFMDGDIMPYCSLDYIFDLSEPEELEPEESESGQPIPHQQHYKQKLKPLLKENVILSWKDEPANTGLFMLQPKIGDYQYIQQIILQKEFNAIHKINKYPWWDPIVGWGHVIQSNDAWKSLYGTTGTNWTWHASFADQGLLYYWTKYIKQNVSHIVRDYIDHYGSNSNSNKSSNSNLPVLERTTYNTLLDYTCSSPSFKNKRNVTIVPHRDFMHFTGTCKYLHRFLSSFVWLCVCVCIC